MGVSPLQGETEQDKVKGTDPKTGTSQRGDGGDPTRNQQPGGGLPQRAEKEQWDGGHVPRGPAHLSLGRSPSGGYIT